MVGLGVAKMFLAGSDTHNFSLFLKTIPHTKKKHVQELPRLGLRVMTSFRTRNALSLRSRSPGVHQTLDLVAAEDTEDVVL